MKRTLLGILAVLLLIGPAAALTLEIPFKTVSEATAAAEYVNLGHCAAGKDVVDLGIPGKSEHQTFRLIVSPTRFIFLEGRDDEVVQVYFGQVLNKEVLVVQEVYDRAGAEARYGLPCNYLFPEGA